MQPERSQADASTPNPARVCDYLLGGKDNFAADRDLAEKMEAEAGEGPSVRELAKVSRRFLLAAATRAAGLGTGQIIELGAGLPRRPSVHETAQSGGEPVRVAYVDSDPMAVSHLTALHQGPGLAAVMADVSDPAAVLGDPALLEVIDLGEPVLLVLGGVLSAMEAGTARSAVAGYAAAVAAGSRVAISCVSYSDPGTGNRMAALFGAAGDWFNHSAADIASFFEAGHLELTAAGGEIMDLRCWPVASQVRRDAAVLGGVGVVR